MEQKDIINEIKEERTRQDSIHKTVGNMHYSLGVLIEEVGEYAAEINENNFALARMELIQVAATAVRILEDLY